MELMRMVQRFLMFWFCLMSIADAYPVESKPLNNNPETWNLGDSWIIFNPLNSSDPSAEALIASSDGHIKAKKITPKSIFIAPHHGHAPVMCPHGYRVDDNGKCIKTVTINQDDILAARITELFGMDKNPDKNSDIDSDYYDFDDEVKSDSDSGPLQINIPLTIDIEEEVDGKKVEYVIEEKVINMRNLDPKLVLTTTTDKIDETTTFAPVAERLDSETTTELMSTLPTEFVQETTQVTTEIPTIKTTDVIVKDDEETTESSTIQTTTDYPITTSLSITSTTIEPSTILITTVKPKSQRLTNRTNQSARLKSSRDKMDRPRKQKTTAISTKTNEKMVNNKLYKIDRDQQVKKNKTRNGSKRPGHRKSTTTTVPTPTEEPVTSVTSQKPFWWLPKGWTIDETKEKPVLVRFWAKQPLKTDERARSHQPNRQRVNSRMPTDNIFKEITAPELFESTKKK